MQDTKLKQLLLEINRKLFNLEEKVQILDERTSSYPTLYNNIDKLVQEIIENRQERTIFSNLIHRLDNRLASIESYLKL